MGFIIKSGGGVPMYPGMFIEYTVTPLLNIPLSWVTEITHMQKPYFFIDEQRVGPMRSGITNIILRKLTMELK